MHNWDSKRSSHREFLKDAVRIVDSPVQIRCTGGKEKITSSNIYRNVGRKREKTVTIRIRNAVSVIAIGIYSKGSVEWCCVIYIYIYIRGVSELPLPRRVFEKCTNDNNFEVIFRSNQSFWSSRLTVLFRDIFNVLIPFPSPSPLPQSHP